MAPTSRPKSSTMKAIRGERGRGGPGFATGLVCQGELTGRVLVLGTGVPGACRGVRGSVCVAMSLPPWVMVRVMLLP
jgi:hypothetical protein